MKLVKKYTLVLGLAVMGILSVVAWIRGEYNRREFAADMRRDHQIVGGVLQAGAREVWRDALTADAETRRLVAAASAVDPAIEFEWIPGASGSGSQQVEGGDFVSRFPIRSGAKQEGVVVLRESLDHIDGLVHANIRLSLIQIGLVVLCGAVASFLLGGWLVGRPVGLLVDHMRRIGRREPSSRVVLESSDELGELATEMNAASQALDEARVTAAVETEARLAAVAQVRHADRLATVGKLAAGIAHELGTPLSVVGGHAQMIADGEVTGSAALESARAIDREATRMGKIVRQLLDFARRKGPEGTTCDPSEVARRCVGLLAPMADTGRVQIEVDVPPTRAQIDEASLQQVLTNLIVNAIHAMPDGGALGVSLARITLAPPASTAPPSAHLRIDVTDTGTGMSDEVKARIFEPFFTTKPIGDGTGLGLAVVYGVVVDHHGWIDVTTSGRGSTFSVYLQEAP